MHFGTSRRTGPARARPHTKPAFARDLHTPLRIEYNI
jgi:hypothetical protein